MSYLVSQKPLDVASVDHGTLEMPKFLAHPIHTRRAQLHLH